MGSGPPGERQSTFTSESSLRSDSVCVFVCVSCGDHVSICVFLVCMRVRLCVCVVCVDIALSLAVVAECSSPLHSSYCAE